MDEIWNSVCFLTAYIFINIPSIAISWPQLQRYFTLASQRLLVLSNCTTLHKTIMLFLLKLINNFIIGWTRMNVLYKRVSNFCKTKPVKHTPSAISSIDLHWNLILGNNNPSHRTELDRHFEFLSLMSYSVNKIFWKNKANPHNKLKWIQFHFYTNTMSENIGVNIF